MKVDLLSQSTIKITLSAQDMSNYNLKYDRLCRPEDDRRSLSRLFSVLRRQSPEAFASSAFANEKRLLVEAFPRCDGGCMLYVSSLYDCSVKKAPCEPVKLICRLYSLESLEGLCRLLSTEKQLAGLSFSSDLYQCGGEYRLAVTPHNACHRHIKRFFAEFGDTLSDELSAAATEERFKVTVMLREM